LGTGGKSDNKKLCEEAGVVGAAHGCFGEGWAMEVDELFADASRK